MVDTGATYTCVSAKDARSQGMAERANAMLKMAKICAGSYLNWLDALPIALMQKHTSHPSQDSYRATNASPTDQGAKQGTPSGAVPKKNFAILCNNQL